MSDLRPSSISALTSDELDLGLVSIPGAAKLIGVSVPTVYRRIAAGDLRAFDISAAGAAQRTIRIARSDLMAILRPVDQAGDAA